MQTSPVVSADRAESGLQAGRASFRAAPNHPAASHRPLQFSEYPHTADLKAGRPEQAEFRDDPTLKGVAGERDDEAAKQIWTEAGDEGQQQSQALLILLTRAAHQIPIY